MMRSLFAGVSGLKANQTRMDVIGNNVANANTVGFKSSRVTFEENIAQVLGSAARPNSGRGGVNPNQVGMGVSVGSTDTIFSQGALEMTGRPLDLAIQGDAFFVVKQGTAQYFTRAGNFALDGTGKLVTASGARVQGYSATAGVLGATIGDISLPVGQPVAARATNTVNVGGNLDATATIGAKVASSLLIHDSQGGTHELRVIFEKTAANEWSWSIDPSVLAAGMTPTPATGTLTFDSTGALTAGTANPQITISPPTSGQIDPITLDLALGAGTPNGLTQFAGISTAGLREQNGYAAGSLESFAVDPTGTIVGSFSNGTTQVLGQVVIAKFSNPAGLGKQGENLWAVSANSGQPAISALSGNDGDSIASGMLEMSNVDLSAELTNMIITQRGFQASGRVVSSADELMQEVVNLKR